VEQLNTSGGLCTVPVNDQVVVCGVGIPASVNFSSNVYGPTIVGVPLMIASEPFMRKRSPGGSAPALITPV
jgi:hypothetical protein